MKCFISCVAIFVLSLTVNAQLLQKLDPNLDLGVGTYQWEDNFVEYGLSVKTIGSLRAGAHFGVSNFLDNGSISFRQTRNRFRIGLDYTFLRHWPVKPSIGFYYLRDTAQHNNYSFQIPFQCSIALKDFLSAYLGTEHVFRSRPFGGPEGSPILVFYRIGLSFHISELTKL